MTGKKDMKNMKVKVWLGKLDLETLLGESWPWFCGFIKKKKKNYIVTCLLQILRLPKINYSKNSLFEAHIHKSS